MNSLKDVLARLFSSLLITLLVAPMASGQTAAPQPSSPSASSQTTAAAQAQFDNRIFAEFDKLVHVNRVKVGDAITAHLTAPAKMRNGTEQAKGSKLVGSIT